MLILVVIVMSAFLQMHDLSNLIMSIISCALDIFFRCVAIILLGCILARTVVLRRWLDHCVTPLA